MTLYITTFFVPLPLPQTFIRSPNQAPLFVSLPPLPSQQHHNFHTKRLVTSLITSPFFFLNILCPILCSVSSLPFSESFASISFFNFSFCVWGRPISYTQVERLCLFQTSKRSMQWWYPPLTLTIIVVFFYHTACVKVHGTVGVEVGDWKQMHTK